MAKIALAAQPVLTMPEPEGVFDATAREIYESVARRAYELFESRGRQYGNDLEDWLRAEITGRSKPQSLIGSRSSRN